MRYMGNQAVDPRYLPLKLSDSSPGGPCSSRSSALWRWGAERVGSAERLARTSALGLFAQRQQPVRWPTQSACPARSYVPIQLQPGGAPQQRRHPQQSERELFHSPTERGLPRRPGHLGRRIQWPRVSIIISVPSRPSAISPAAARLQRLLPPAYQRAQTYRLDSAAPARPRVSRKPALAASARSR